MYICIYDVLTVICWMKDTRYPPLTLDILGSPQRTALFRRARTECHIQSFIHPSHQVTVRPLTDRRQLSFYAEAGEKLCPTYTRERLIADSFWTSCEMYKQTLSYISANITGEEPSLALTGCHSTVWKRIREKWRHLMSEQLINCLFVPCKAIKC